MHHLHESTGFPWIQPDTGFKIGEIKIATALAYPKRNKTTTPVLPITLTDTMCTQSPKRLQNHRKTFSYSLNFKVIQATSAYIFLQKNPSLYIVLGPGDNLKIANQPSFISRAAGTEPVAAS